MAQNVMFCSVLWIVVAIIAGAQSSTTTMTLPTTLTTTTTTGTLPTTLTTTTETQPTTLTTTTTGTLPTTLTTTTTGTQPTTLTTTTTGTQPTTLTTTTTGTQPTTLTTTTTGTQPTTLTTTTTETLPTTLTTITVTPPTTLTPSTTTVIPPTTLTTSTTFTQSETTTKTLTSGETTTTTGTTEAPTAPPAWQHTVVIIVSVLGAMLLISLGLLLLVTRMLSKKRLKRNNSFDRESFINQSAPKAPLINGNSVNSQGKGSTNGLAAFTKTGVLRLPRATVNDSWNSSTSLEMTGRNSRQKLFPVGRNLWLNNIRGDSNASTQAPSQNNSYDQNQGYDNPYYMQDNGN